jgi:hypothetical protein
VNEIQKEQIGRVVTTGRVTTIGEEQVGNNARVV